MQHPAVPELAHTVDRPWATRPIHWVATAAALAAVVAASGFLQPDPATAAQTGPGAHARSAPAPAPDPAAVDLPLVCPTRPVVAKKASGDLDGDGSPETVVSAHCEAGSGSPPHALYVITRPRAGEPRVVATLVDTKDQLTVSDLTVRGGAVTATLLGYSSLDVPRCCPDRHDEAKWQWKNGAFTRSTPAAAGSV
ncbi:hypothetical protein GPA10_36645 [Streptomyces sp. p1417]|uniref:Secreted protein n=1 Tax=Streptomyces typhae TaxID=2681492 RepID=A0A6L6X888_9ACTN|nr:hypothetical protein [Streptomyces typhae]